MTDRIIFVCVIVLASIYLYAASQMPVPQIGDPLGPKAFPILLGVAMLAVAILLLIEIRRDTRTSVENVALAPSAEKNRSHLLVITGVVAWIALYYLSFEKLGYLISTTIFLFVLCSCFHRGKWVTNAVTVVLFSVISYWLFTKVLGVTLAKGLLPF
ncbi:MAG: tripartite tricarboxylate transporter TctB family protein [Burkholderiales bacterium]